MNANTLSIQASGGDAKENTSKQYFRGIILLIVLIGNSVVKDPDFEV